MMTALDYIEAIKDPKLREIAFLMHHLILTYPNFTSRLSFKLPFYYRKRWVCYLNMTKDQKLEFAFIRGNEFSNKQGALQVNGRKQVRGIFLSDPDSIPFDLIDELMQEAMQIDDTKYQSLKKANRKN